MKNQIIYLEEKNYKVFGFDENLILVSSKRHEDFKSLLASSKKSGLLENFQQINIAKLKKIQHSEDSRTLKFEYTNKEKSKSNSYNFSLPDSHKKVALAISDLKGFKKSEIKEASRNPLLLNLLGLVFTIVGTFGFVWVSNQSAAGVAYESSGRRGRSNEAVYEMLGKIPSEIIYLIGAGIFCWLLYKTWLRFKNPLTITQYS